MSLHCKEGPRRNNGRPRGTGVLTPDAFDSLLGVPDRFSGSPRVPFDTNGAEMWQKGLVELHAEREELISAERILKGEGLDRAVEFVRRDIKWLDRDIAAEETRQFDVARNACKIWRGDERVTIPDVRWPVMVCVGQYHDGERRRVDFEDLDGFHISNATTRGAVAAYLEDDTLVLITKIANPVVQPLIRQLVEDFFLLGELVS